MSRCPVHLCYRIDGRGEGGGNVQKRGYRLRPEESVVERGARRAARVASGGGAGAAQTDRASLARKRGTFPHAGGGGEGLCDHHARRRGPCHQLEHRRRLGPWLRGQPNHWPTFFRFLSARGGEAEKTG